MEIARNSLALGVFRTLGPRLALALVALLFVLPASAKSVSASHVVVPEGSDAGPASTGVQPSDHETADTLPDVKIYCASWCQWCAKTKVWFTEKEIPFTATDVDKLEGAARKAAEDEMRALARQVSYPLTVIGSKVVKGYNPGAFERALKAAQRK